MQREGSDIKISCMNALFEWCARKYFGPLFFSALNADAMPRDLPTYQLPIQ